jgi:hypothetical protein
LDQAWDVLVRGQKILAAWLLIAERGLKGMSTREVLAAHWGAARVGLPSLPPGSYGADRARHRPLPAVYAGTDRRD